jgi:hypothetical protein
VFIKNLPFFLRRQAQRSSQKESYTLSETIATKKMLGLGGTHEPKETLATAITVG